jgi:diketogulonate reductase-like aldo/keto reductase
VPIFPQISFNPYNYAQNKALLAYSAKHGIVTEAYSSLAYGVVFINPLPVQPT